MRSVARSVAWRSVHDVVPQLALLLVPEAKLSKWLISLHAGGGAVLYELISCVLGRWLCKGNLELRIRTCYS
jgi:hypothetical protein